MVTYLEMKDALSGGRKTDFSANDIFERVADYLKTVPELEEPHRILDYALPEGRDNGLSRAIENGGEMLRIRADVNTGGSEGVYIDCYAVVECSSEDGCDSKLITRDFRLGTYKTLYEDMDAYIKMGQIAGAFVMAAETYIAMNL